MWHRTSVTSARYSSRTTTLSLAPASLHRACAALAHSAEAAILTVPDNLAALDAVVDRVAAHLAECA